MGGGELEVLRYLAIRRRRGQRQFPLHLLAGIHRHGPAPAGVVVEGRSAPVVAREIIQRSGEIVGRRRGLVGSDYHHYLFEQVGAAAQETALREVTAGTPSSPLLERGVGGSHAAEEPLHCLLHPDCRLLKGAPDPV